MSKIDHSLFSANEHALEDAYGPCPKCGKSLHIRHGKAGPFIGCTGYPDCDYIKPLHEHQTTVLKEISGTACPECGSSLAIKKGRYGMFIGCTNFPACHHIEQIKQHQETAIDCPQCRKGQLIERTNKYGKRFFSCNRYPQCRYVVNSTPLAEPCPACGWGILVEKKGKKHCPQADCNYTSD